ncbi:MAG TPA: immunoglobulin-like domain-containing protein [Bacillales bacterium]|nr:immunoglobulin-like domain-containing protein [Bacillales bacterium]
MGVIAKRAARSKTTILFLCLILVASNFLPWVPFVNEAGAAGTEASLIQSSDGETLYSSGNKIIDNGLILSNFGEIQQATVMIQNVRAGDLLGFTDQSGITGTYEASNGILTLKGAASTAEYQQALRRVSFSTTSEDRTKRNIVFSIGSGLYFDGHYYEFVASGDTWSEAKAASELRTLYGRQGYLATITSQEENDFIAQKALGTGWLGGRSIDNDGGDWRWVTGPEGLENGNTGMVLGQGFNKGTDSFKPAEGVYTNWSAGEPNNYQTTHEYYAHMYGPGEGDKQGKWNDFPNDTTAIQGYIVEYGGMPNDDPITPRTVKTISFFSTATGITLSRHSLKLSMEDDPVHLTATVQPIYADDKSVTWSSDDVGVATVDANGNVTPVGAGTATITVTTADGGNTATCEVTVVDVYLTGIQVFKPSDLANPLTLTPSPFDRNTLDYFVDLDHGNAVKIKPTTDIANATITIRGKRVDSGTISTNAFPVRRGHTTYIPIVVSANGFTKTYTISLLSAASENANLANLTPTEGVLSGFNSSDTAYTLTVENQVDSLKFIPTLEDQKASVKVNGESVTSGNKSQEIPLSVGDNTVTVVVTAQNGTSKTYTVNVTREESSNANLLSLIVDAGELSPAFDQDLTDYYLIVDPDTTSVGITPTVEQSDASIAMGGSSATSGVLQNVAVSAGSSISIKVTAQDGTTVKTYNLKVLARDHVSLVYNDFSQSADSLQINHDATIEGDELVLTPNKGFQSGSTFYKNRVSLANGRSFSTFFSFTMSGSGGIGQADGLAFTIQTDSNTAGSAGGGIGYAGIQPSIAIEFDSWTNSYYEDPADPHIGLDVNGNMESVKTELADPVDFRDGSTYYAWIDYDGKTKTIEVRLSDSSARPVNAKMTATDIDLTQILDQDEVFVGFTAGTGGASQRHAIQEWYFTNNYNPIDTGSYSYKELPSEVTLTASAASNTDHTTLTAIVKNNNGETVAGVPVTFSTTRGVLGSTIVETNADGQATTSLDAAVESGDAKVKAVARGGAYDKLTVIGLILNNTDSVATDKKNLEIQYAPGDSQSSVTQNVTLPGSGTNGTTVIWESDNTSIIDADGNVTRPDYFTGDQLVTLTATVTKNEVTETKTFIVYVKKLPYAAPELTFTDSNSTITESPNNDGSLIGSKVITLSGGSFKDSIITTDGGIQGVRANNLPAGVGITAVRSADGKTLTIEFEGKAAKHSSEFSVDNVSFTIAKDQIEGSLTDLTTSSFPIEFTNPAKLTMAQGAVNESTEVGGQYNTGKLVDSLKVSIENGTFSNSISKADVSINHLPLGLAIDTVTKDSDTSITITFTDDAAIENDNENDSYNASVVVSADAIVGSDTALTSNTFKINFNEPEPSIAVLSQKLLESDTNDGSIEGSLTVELKHGTFSSAIGVEDIKTNLPEDLSIGSVVKDSETQLTLNIAGTAENHRAINSIYNATIGVSASKIAPTATKTGTDPEETIDLAERGIYYVESNSFSVVFQDPPPVIEASPAKISDNLDGSIDETLTVTLENGTFAADMSEGVVVHNLPEGVGIKVTRVSDTELTLSFTGEAVNQISASDHASVTISQIKINGATADVTSNEFNFDAPSDHTLANRDKEDLGIVYEPGENSDNVKSNIGLDDAGPNGSTITWVSSDGTVITNEGSVTRPSYTDGDQAVTMTATIANGSVSETKEFDLTVKALPMTDVEAVDLDEASLALSYADGDSAESVTQDIGIEFAGANGSFISWEASPEGVIDPATGKVTRPSYIEGDQDVTLTATITNGEVSETKIFEVTVKALPITDAEEVQLDKASLAIGYAEGDSAESVTQDITIDFPGENGSSIAWKVDPDNVIDPSAGKVTRPSYIEGDQDVTLTATITNGEAAETKIFNLTVKALPITSEEAVQLDKATLVIGYAEGDNKDSVTQDITLETIGANESTITWVSSDDTWITDNGTVTRPSFTQGDQTVTMTATIENGTATDTKEFVVTVIALPITDAEAVQLDKDSLAIGYAEGDSADSVTQDITLETIGENESTITWVSSDETWITDDGTVTRPSFTKGDQTVTMTATIENGTVTDTKEFVLIVKALPITEAEAVQLDKDSVEIEYADGDSAASVTQDITIKEPGTHGSLISWVVNPVDVIDPATGEVTRPSYIEGDQKVTMTATITNGEVTETKIFKMTVKALPITEEEAVQLDMGSLGIEYADGDSADSVTQDITIKYLGSHGSSVSLAVNPEDVIDPETGKVTRASYIEGDKAVTLVATITNGEASETKIFNLTVKSLPITEAEAVQLDKTALEIGYADGDNKDSVTQDITLKTTGKNKSSITWTVSPEGVIDPDSGAVTRPNYGEANQKVTLTATITNGKVTETKIFEVNVIAQPLDEEKVASLLQNAESSREDYLSSGGADSDDWYQETDEATQALNQALEAKPQVPVDIIGAMEELESEINQLDEVTVVLNDDDQQEEIRNEIETRIEDVNSVPEAEDVAKDIGNSKLRENTKQELQEDLLEQATNLDNEIRLSDSEDLTSLKEVVEESELPNPQKQAYYEKVAEKAIQDLSRSDKETEDRRFQKQENIAVADFIKETFTGEKRTRLSTEHELRVVSLSLSLEKAFAFAAGDTWESITSPFIMLSSGDYNTSITWESSAPGVINVVNVNGKITGDIHRLAEDRNVILTATIHKGDLTIEKRFLLVVKSDRFIEKVIHDNLRPVQVEAGETPPSMIAAIQRIVLRTSGELTGEVIKNTIDKVKVTDEMIGNGDMSIFIPDDPEDIADEYAVEVPQDVLQTFDGQSLEIRTTQGTIILSEQSIENMKAGGIGLYFRIVPVREEAEQQGIFTRVKQKATQQNQSIQSLGIPREIETNYKGYRTDIVLPLRNILIENPDIDLDTLRVFIEHSDGENKMVKGEIVYDESGKPYGIKFMVEKFSTFTIVRINPPKESVDQPAATNGENDSNDGHNPDGQSENAGTESVEEIVDATHIGEEDDIKNHDTETESKQAEDEPKTKTTNDSNEQASGPNDTVVDESVQTNSSHLWGWLLGVVIAAGFFFIILFRRKRKDEEEEEEEELN